MLVLNLNTVVVVADFTLVHLGFRVLIRSGLAMVPRIGSLRLAFEEFKLA